MKATEDTIFAACDRCVQTKHRHPTADELVKEVGGGKKEVLALLNKWKAMRYLQENGLNVPVRWISLLSEFFKSVNEDVDAEKRQAIEDAQMPLEELRKELDHKNQIHGEISGQLHQANITIREYEKVISDLKESINALEQQVADLADQKIQLNAEISEKSLQVRLQKDQISDLKSEHQKVLDRLESRLSEQKADRQELQAKYDHELKVSSQLKDDYRESLALEKEKYGSLAAQYKEIKDKLSESQQEKIKVEQVSAEKDGRLESQRDEIRKLNELVLRLPKLEDKIKSLEDELSREKAANQQGVNDVMQGMVDQLKNLTDRLNKTSEGENEKSPETKKGNNKRD